MTPSDKDLAATIIRILGQLCDARQARRVVELLLMTMPVEK